MTNEAKMTKGEVELVNEWAHKSISSKTPATIARLRNSLRSKGLLTPTGAPTTECYALAAKKDQ